MGREIRRILLDAASTDLRPLPEALLYFASRAQNVEEIILPALAKGSIVLADRFTDASMAYQGYGRGLGEEIVMALDRLACRGLQPDLTFLIDIDIETSLWRALTRNSGGRPNESRMERESADFHERVRAGYLEIAARNPSRVRIIDGRKTPDEVADEIWSAAGSFLAARRVR